ncbi:MAG: GNAT family N-acetyltransferase [Christensenellales bacterium]
MQKEWEIVQVEKQEIETFSQYAKGIWGEYFTALLSGEQIAYMLDMFLSVEVLTKQFDGDYKYFYCYYRGEKVGFIGLEYEKDALFLSKLYLSKEFRGRGLASRMFAFIEQQAKSCGLNRIYLTCNKYNKHSLDVYAAKGFEIVESVMTDIGQGFVMDDYVLEKKL